MKKILSVLLLTLLIATLTGPIPAQAASSVLHVKPIASGDENCSSWANACTLQTALGLAEATDEIWVATGTHSPGTNRDDTFALKSGVAVYGGFPNTGTPVWTDRNWETNPTVLEGTQNNYHVVSSINTTTSPIDESTILDGFIIQNGVADGPELLDVGQSEDSEKDKKGGGIYNLGGSPTLRNLVIKDNYAEYDGGGLYNEGGSPLLENVRFENNEANPDYPEDDINDFSYGYGGGMQNIGGSPELVDVHFSGNRAIRGGALSNINASSPEITGVIFENNQATRVGGAIFNNTNSNSALTNVRFENNQSGRSGGAIYTNNSIPSINRAYFIENRGAAGGAYFGGAMYYRFDEDFTGSPTPSVVNAIFYKNSAADGGGAIYLLRDNSPTPNLSITNVTFYENSSRNATGGTIDGGAIAYDGNSTLTIKNTIAWGNLSKTDGSEPQPSQLSGTGTTNVTYSIVQGGWSGEGNLNADPRFVDPAAGNLKLQGSSPAIDAGDPIDDCPTEDIEGTSRPQQGTSGNLVCDIGVYEVITNFFETRTMWIDDFNLNAGWRMTDHPRMMADVNGDGMADIVGFGSSGVWVSLSTGSGFLPRTMWIDDFNLNAGWRMTDHPRMMADVNGDGMADIVGFGSSGVWISLSTGTGFLPRTMWIDDFNLNAGWRMTDHPRMMADVNGDSMADIVGFGSSGVWVSLSTGTGFLPRTMWIDDFNLNAGWRMTDHPRMMADVNDDGMADIVGFGSSGVWVSLSTGSGFLPRTMWIDDFNLNAGWRMTDHPRMMADVNDDGMADIVGFGSSGVWVSLSTGNGFLPRTMWIDDFNLNAGWRMTDHPRMMADVNGDSRADIVGFGSSGVWVSISK
jgi:predicted outer membrane repeat protein